MPMHPGAQRIVRAAGDVLERLLALSGSDRTTLLLEEAERRVPAVRPADVLRQYRSDRFVQAPRVDRNQLQPIIDDAIGAVAPRFDVIELAPLVPLGSHAALGGVAQDRIVTTVRQAEVAADPTVGLTLEAALRRKASGDATEVRVAAIQRVVRANFPMTPLHLGHFSLLGIVTAGRDRGSRAFEREALTEHIRLLTRIIEQRGHESVTVKLTDFDGSGASLLADLRTELDGIETHVWPERPHGAGYYPGVCFHIFVTIGGEEHGIADGGIVDWTQRLLADRKERLVTSGISVERLAMLMHK